MRKALFLVAFVALIGASVVGPGPSRAQAAPQPFHCNQVNLHPGALQNGQISVAYSDTMWLTPANVALPITVFSVVSGTLPPGLSLVAGPNANQVTLQGVPTATGTFTFTVEIGGTYVLGTICKVSQTYTVTIF
jgi:hypothetical protein